MEGNTSHVSLLITKVEQRELKVDGLKDFIKHPMHIKITEALGDEEYVKALTNEEPMDVPTEGPREVKNKLLSLDPFFLSKIAHAYKDYAGKGVCFVDISRFPFVVTYVNIKDPKEYASDFDETFGKVFMETWDAHTEGKGLMLIIANANMETVALKLMDVTNPIVYSLGDPKEFVAVETEVTKD